MDHENCLNRFLENYINQKFVKIDNIIYYKQNNILRKVINNQEEKWKLINVAHYKVLIKKIDYKSTLQ